MNKFNVINTRANRLEAGLVNPNGLFTGKRHDVTKTAVGAVAEHLLACQESLEFECNGKTYHLKVVEVVAESDKKYRVKSKPDAGTLRWVEKWDRKYGEISFTHRDARAELFTKEDANFVKTCLEKHGKDGKITVVKVEE